MLLAAEADIGLPVEVAWVALGFLGVALATAAFGVLFGKVRRLRTRVDDLERAVERLQRRPSRDDR